MDRTVSGQFAHDTHHRIRAVIGLEVLHGDGDHPFVFQFLDEGFGDDRDLQG